MTQRQQILMKQQRRGSVLPWFAALLFVFLPLAALVVDLSLARLTRRQMQTAVNSAALEGLRFRDSIPVSVLRTIVDCPGCSTEAEFLEDVKNNDPECNCSAETDDHNQVPDYLRRRLAQRLTHAIYDDDLLAIPSDDALNFGAGPDVEFSGGIEIDGPGSFRAGDTTTLLEPPVYKPHSELNLGNDVGGDLVAGHYISNDELHEESDSYIRTDFEASGTPEDGFVARLQRTGNPAAEGVRSDGRTVPFLFGRGANTAAINTFPEASDDSPTAIWNRRERGAIVRATGIAVAQPVYRTGVPGDDVTDGVGLFAINADQWVALSAGVHEIRIDANEILRIEQSEPTMEPTAVLIGRFFASDATRDVVTVGDALPEVTDPIADREFVKRYIPLFADVNGTDRVVGFGLAVLVSATSLEKMPSRVVTQNASATWIPPEVSAADWPQLTAAIQELLANPGSYSLLAPALVRTIP